MAQRTYLPRLVAIARLLCNYMRRYEAQIKGRLTAPQIALFDALLTACDALEAAITFPAPTQ